MLSVGMLNALILSVLVLSVIKLSVVAPNPSLPVQAPSLTDFSPSLPD